MDIPHPYWTQIPQDPNPVSEFGRDGVAAEDDMALRALLPQIRPRRGRRKPEDDGLSKSPSQRPRLDSPPNAETFHALRNDTMEAWTAHPDGRTTFSFSALDVNNLGLTPNQGAGQHWGTMDMAQTPLMAYPQSAITPSTRNPFWNDEPRSAITPSKPKSLHRRHGAKVVSSAWRSTGIGGIRKKRRGRPPLSLSTTDGPFSAFPADTVSLKSNTPENDGCRSAATTGSISAPPPVPTANMSSTIPTPISSTRSPSIPANMSLQNLPTQASRPGKPSRLSLQVPQRQGGTVVRLATPPMVTVNGQTTDANAAGDTMDLGHAGQHMDLDSQPMNLNAHGGFAQNIFALEPSSMSGMYQVQAQAHHQVAPPPTVTAPQINFDVEEDRTNVDDLLAFFLQELLAAHWTDANDNEIPACDLDEARAIVNTLLDSIHKSSPNTETFLINVSALAGGKLLMTTSNLRVKRVEEGPDYTRYTCVWELRLGFRRGYYSTTVTVPHSSWKSDAAKAAEADKDAEADEDDDASHDNSEDGGEEDGSAAATAAGGSMWQKKYRELLAVVERKDRQIADIKKHLLDTLKEDPRTG